jgi:hypothetical protein
MPAMRTSMMDSCVTPYSAGLDALQHQQLLWEDLQRQQQRAQNLTMFVSFPSPGIVQEIP